MKLKNIHRTVLVICGLIQTISGISCLIVGTLLNYDQNVDALHVSQTRSYGSQNWLGLPLLFHGIVLLILAMVHKKIKIIHIVMMISITFPYLALTLVGSILHGISYEHFLSTDRQLTYFSHFGYNCQDEEDTKQCQCVKKETSSNQDNKIVFNLLCGTQTKLLQFHGSLLSFAAISFGALLGILTMNIIFLFHILNLQSTVNAVENQGFTQTEDRRHDTTTTPVHEEEVGGSGSEHVTQNETHSIHEPPPPYESLVATFNVTGVMIGRNPTSNVPVRHHEINRHARVRYRGEQSTGTNSFPLVRVANPQRQTMQQEITRSTGRNNGNNSEQSSGADETIPSEEPATADDDGLRPHEHQEQDNSSQCSEAGIYLDISLSENHVNNPQAAVHFRGPRDSSQRNYIQALSERSPSQEASPARINVPTSEHNENMRLQTAVFEGESSQHSTTNNHDIETEGEHQGSLQENVGNNVEHEISPQQRSVQGSTTSNQNTNSDVEDQQSQSGQMPQVASTTTRNVENIVDNGEQSSTSQQTEYSNGSGANNQDEQLQDNDDPASGTGVSETRASHASSTQEGLPPPSTAHSSNIITAEPNSREHNRTRNIRETLPQLLPQNLINIGDI